MSYEVKVHKYRITVDEGMPPRLKFFRNDIMWAEAQADFSHSQLMLALVQRIHELEEKVKVTPDLMYETTPDIALELVTELDEDYFNLHHLPN